MCGIVAYIGHRDACPIIIKGLKRLEYRGYDSAGIALLNGGLSIYKKKGKVEELERLLEGVQGLHSNIGIGHTRWATHGAPSDENAHPHLSGDGKMAIIHNGIIENYASLRQDLENKGHVFRSETDTEVLVHFIEEIKQQEACSLEEAVRLALNKVIGAYAIVVLSQEDEHKLIAARRSSPLVIGIGEGEYFVASDATPIIEYTNRVVFLNDNEFSVITREGITIRDLQDVPTTPYIEQLDIELEAIEKGGYSHFMLKEIFEQPRSVYDSMRGRLDASTGRLTLGGLIEYQNRLINTDRIIMIGCGTSWHAALVGEYIFEELARVPVEVEYASEFRYRNPIIRENDIVIAISQSGETADTIAALQIAKSKGALILGVCNVVGSTIARMTHAGAYTHAGPEIGVASTKAFTAQLVVLSMMALFTAHKKGTISEARFRQLLVALETLPVKLEETLQRVHEPIQQIAHLFKDARNFLYLGRGYNYPVALEGALKLKEISYIHAEGYPAAEMKHGPIALIDKEMPVVFIALQDSSYEKIISNIQEVKAREGRVIAIVNEGDEMVKNMVEFAIEIPKTEEIFSPVLSVLPLQLLAYHIAVLRGCDVDQPRNLAKSVTVE